MANIAPAGNVQAAAIAAFATPIMEHILTANGVILPPDALAAAPGAIAVVIAYMIDVFTPQEPKT